MDIVEQLFQKKSTKAQKGTKPFALWLTAVVSYNKLWKVSTTLNFFTKH
jgi:hypothetical protein